MSRQEPRVKWYFALAFAVGTLTVVAFIYDDFNYYCFEMQVVFYSIHSVYITSYVLCTLYICRQLNKGLRIKMCLKDFDALFHLRQPKKGASKF